MLDILYADHDSGKIEILNVLRDGEHSTTYDNKEFTPLLFFFPKLIF